MAGGWLKIAYQLRIYHYFAGWPLDRWLVTLPWGVAFLLVLAGRSSLHWQGWLLVMLLALIGFAILVLRRQAADRLYVIFTAQPNCRLPPVSLLIRLIKSCFMQRAYTRWKAKLTSLPIC